MKVYGEDRVLVRVRVGLQWEGESEIVIQVYILVGLTLKLMVRCQSKVQGQM